jgi:hypothetical protein
MKSFNNIKSDLQSIFSMLDIFIRSNQVSELGESYFKKVALPIICEESKDWKPKDIHEAHLILKNYFKKIKSQKPNFLIDN